MSKAGVHQYLKRETAEVCTENLCWDGLVRFLYSNLREKAPVLFRAVTSARISSVLGFLNYDSFLSGRIANHKAFLKACGVDLEECLEDPDNLDTLKKIFERRIRYWDLRPMPDDPAAVVSPADSRVLPGSFADSSLLYVKGKFFDLDELLGLRRGWAAKFQEGDFAVFRLTPDKYHYNHTPAAGRVVDFYEISGRYHSCNPDAVIPIVTPYSKNKRVITIIDTDVPGGTQAGLIAMVEVAALMIGGIVQCYSSERYDSPVPVSRGIFLEKGCPKSVYRPGSSTDILVFQKDRIEFAEDLVRNRLNTSIESRYTKGFGASLAETDLKVRSLLARSKRRTE